MANTRHGHHIDGTPVEESESRITQRNCGGPGHCSQCTREAWVVINKASS